MNEKPFEDLKHCMASLTKGVVKFAQVPPAQRFAELGRAIWGCMLGANTDLLRPS